MAVGKDYRKKYSGHNDNQMEIRSISKLMSMSDEGIRKYEKKGLVWPDINPESGRRSFDVMDFTMLLYSRVYKKSDFSIKEISQIVNNSDLKGIDNMYERKIMEKEAEVRDTLRVIECLKDVSSYIKKIPELLNNCEIAAFPGLFRIEFLDDGKEWFQNSKVISIVSDWVNYSPCTMISSRYLIETLLCGKQPEISYSGLGMLAKYASELGIEENEFIEYCPPCKKSLHTIIAADNIQLIADMNYIHDYIKDNNLKPIGDAVTLGIASNNYDSTFTRYMNLWIPLSDD